MDKKERDKKLEEIFSGSQGEILLDYLEEKKTELKDITSVKTYEELVGRQEAVKIFEKIMGFIYRQREKKEVIKNNQYK